MDDKDTKTDKITPEILRSWGPCSDGYKRFCELFPDGADLETAMKGLTDDDHDSWAYWLFEKCRDKGLFEVTVLRGYRNSGNRNSGDRNSGDRNSGDWNSGDRNSGYRNSGYRNSGDRNSGDWNSGDLNSGFFNTITPDDILVFNKPCKRSVWNAADKPDFIYFDLTVWVPESEMTDQEKINHPKFFVAGGYLKTIPYKEAWATAYEKATDADKAKLKALPNFDADVFYEISGIRVDYKWMIRNIALCMPLRTWQPEN